MANYTVRRVRLNAGGYELPGGFRYWGSGSPLFVAIDKETGDELAHVRAGDRAQAITRFAICAQRANKWGLIMSTVANSGNFE
jgi:hypothetical protein